MNETKFKTQFYSKMAWNVCRIRKCMSGNSISYQYVWYTFSIPASPIFWKPFRIHVLEEIAKRRYGTQQLCQFSAYSGWLYKTKYKHKKNLTFSSICWRLSKFWAKMSRFWLCTLFPRNAMLSVLYDERGPRRRHPKSTNVIQLGFFIPYYLLNGPRGGGIFFSQEFRLKYALGPF